MATENVDEMEMVDNSQSKPKFERDRLKDDKRKDYCTDSEGTSNIVGKFQKMSSTRVVIRPSKLNL